jgi:hypothetical protein
MKPRAALHHHRSLANRVSAKRQLARKQKRRDRKWAQITVYLLGTTPLVLRPGSFGPNR